jgi:hypothetical protein
MSFEILRRQLVQLKARLPEEIVSRLRDGTEFRHPGPVLDFVVQGLREAFYGAGSVWTACRNSDQVSISRTHAPAINSSRLYGTPGQGIAQDGNRLPSI